MHLEFSQCRPNLKKGGPTRNFANYPNHFFPHTLTLLAGTWETADDFLLACSFGLSFSFCAPVPTCFVMASLVVNLPFPFPFFAFFFEKKSSNDLSSSAIFLHEKFPGKRPGKGNKILTGKLIYVSNTPLSVLFLRYKIMRFFFCACGVCSSRPSLFASKIWPGY